MATVIRNCRVCGKEYEMCANARRVDGVFRWQEVACSPYCGEEYLAAVLRGRSGAVETTENSSAYVEIEENFEDDEELDDEDDFDIELL